MRSSAANSVWILPLIIAIAGLGNCAPDSSQLCYAGTVIGGNFLNIINVTDKFPVGSVLMFLNFTGNNNQIVLQLSPPNEYIFLANTTRNLTVQETLINMGAQTIVLTVACTVRATGVIAYYQVMVVIYDTNNHPPTFVTPPYSCNISELAKVGSTVISGITAEDLDPGDQGYLGFYIAPGPYSTSFVIPTVTVGKLVLKTVLNYEQVQTINLTLLVKDNIVNWTAMGQVQPQFTATTSVIINIISASDPNPVFSQTTYTGTVDSDAQPNTVVITDSAISTNDGSTCFYTIVDGNDGSSYFSIENTTGVIRTTQLLGFSRIIAFQVQILVNFDVDLMPQFTSAIYNGSVVETSPAGTFVTRVEARVANEIVPMQYSFADYETDFVIDAISGEIRTSQNFCYSTASNYTLRVQATADNNTSYADVFVTVLKPLTYLVRFNQSLYQFNMNSESSFIGQVQATSLGYNGQIYFTILEGPIIFSVDAEGRLWTNVALNSTSYNLIISAQCNDTQQIFARDVTLVNVLVGPTVPEQTVTFATPERYDIIVIVVAVVCVILLMAIIALVITICRRWSASPCCLVWLWRAITRQRGMVIQRDLDTEDKAVSVTLIDYTLVNQRTTAAEGSRAYGKDKAGFRSAEADKSFSRKFGLQQTEENYSCAVTGDTRSTSLVDTTKEDDCNNTLRKLHRSRDPVCEPGTVIFLENKNDSQRATQSVTGVSDRSGTLFNTSAFTADSSSDVTNSSHVSSDCTVIENNNQPSPIPGLKPPMTGGSKPAPKNETPAYANTRLGNQSTQNKMASLPMTPSLFGPPAGIWGGVTVDEKWSDNKTKPPTVDPFRTLVLEDDYGTSSTETLVHTSPKSKPRSSKLLFIDNNIDYTSSQETMTASQTAVARQTAEEAPSLTIYY